MRLLLMSAISLVVALCSVASAEECRWDTGRRVWVCPQPRPPQSLHDGGWSERRWQERHWEHEWRHRERCERHPLECQ